MRYGCTASRSSAAPPSRSGVSAAAIVLAILAMLLAPRPASASEPFPNTNVRDPQLEVNSKGEALVTYTTSGGTFRHVLVWGAINARQPNPTIPQVHFKYDYSGGWKSRHDANYWK